MQLEEAVLSRRSIRSFRPDPVPPAVLLELVQMARWAPSAANTQPWEFILVGGEPLQKLRLRLRQAAVADPVGKPEMSWPANLPERFKKRRLEVGDAVLQALGIPADDKAKKNEWFLAGINFFDAPHVVLLVMDRCFTELAAMDVGAVAMTLELLAHGKGLGACPQAAPLRYPHVFHEVLEIPADKRVMLAIPVGYPNLDAAVNRFPRSRAHIREMTTWAGLKPSDVEGQAG